MIENTELLLKSIVSLQKKLQGYLNENFKDYNLKSPEIITLHLLDKENLTQVELAKLLKCDKSHIHRTITKLAEKGFIEFDDRTHNKNLKLSLTQQGKSISQKIDENMKLWHEILFKGISEKDVELIKKIFNKFIENTKNIKTGGNNA